MKKIKNISKIVASLGLIALSGCSHDAEVLSSKKYSGIVNDPCIEYKVKILDKPEDTLFVYRLIKTQDSLYQKGDIIKIEDYEIEKDSISLLK